MSYTSNLNLLLTPASDTNTTFKTWRVGINGEDDSNMLKIDAAYGNLDTRVTAAQAKADSVAEKVFGGGIETWKDVQDIVRSGAAAQYFDIGDQLVAEKLSSVTANKGSSTGITGVSVTAATFLTAIGETKAGTYTYTYDGANWRDVGGATVALTTTYGVELTGTPAVGDVVNVVVATTSYTFDIIGIDHDTPSDNTKTHSMTLQLHNQLSSTMTFDAKEAFYYAENGLTAGTYHFTVQDDAWYTSDNGKTYQFTLASDAAAGSQLVFGNAYDATFANSTISVYSSADSTTAAQTATVTLGSSGTDLGAVNNTGNMNHMHRALRGNNRWTQSSLRQWLNTDGAANTWWTAKNNFDRPSNASVAGFLKDFDASFLAVLGDVSKSTQLSVADGYGLEASTERFFLLSRPEVYMGAERSTDGPDGKVYTYYGPGYSSLNAPGTGADSHRVKYRGGTAADGWLRTPNASNGNRVRDVNTGGSMDNGNAYSSLGVAPACVIV